MHNGNHENVRNIIESHGAAKATNLAFVSNNVSDQPGK